MKRLLLAFCLCAGSLFGTLRPWYDAPPYYGRIKLVGNFRRPTFDARIAQTVKTETQTFQCVYKLPNGGAFFVHDVTLFPGENTFVARNGIEEDTLRIYTTPYPTYPLKIQLKWSGNNQDYDLKVNDIDYTSPNGEAGGLDHDWKRNGDPGGPIETVAYANAPAGKYSIYVTYFADHEGENDGKDAVPTEVAVEWRGKVIFREKRTLSTVKSRWPVGTLVIHSGHAIGGFAVDGETGKGALCPHPMGVFRGIDRAALGAFRYTSLQTPAANGTPVYLDMGEVAQFQASGDVNITSDKDKIPQVEVLDGFYASPGLGGDFIDRFLGVYRNTGNGSSVLRLYASSSGEDEHERLTKTIHNVRWTRVMLGDHNRNGDIEDGGTTETSDTAFEGDPILVWVNDCSAQGDYAADAGDCVPEHSLAANWRNDHVDGRYDLPNFTPIALNLHDILEGLPSETFTYKLHHAESAVNVVWTNLSCHSCDDFYRSDDVLCGRNLDKPPCEAPIETVTKNGISIPAAFLDKIASNARFGVMMLEGRTPSNALLTLSVYAKDAPAEALYTYELPLNVVPIESMYHTIDLRPAITAPGQTITLPPLPEHAITPQTSDKHLLFLHGYNVSQTNARGWAAEIFKRLYRSGSKARFTAITWEGDESRILGSDTTPNYYVNVINAFDTATALNIVLGRLPGKKTILAHSLGNMLAAAAIKARPDLVANYVMLNAALPSEAFNETSHAPTMIPTDWRDYSPHVYASNWHQLFTDATDSRSTLTWRNFFRPILESKVNVYNFYSSSEDVLGHAPAEGNATLSDNVWVYQEQQKGRWPLWLLPGRTACEGGWGNNLSLTVPSAPEKVNAMTREQLIKTPIFTPFDDRLHATTNAISFTPSMRLRLLADGIPALSHAVGATSIDIKNEYDMHQLLTRPNENMKWPTDEEQWKHSDIRALAYPFSYRVFERIVQDLGLKQKEANQ